MRNFEDLRGSNKSGEKDDPNFKDIDPLLVEEIQKVQVLEPVKLSSPLYYVKDATRKAYPFNHDAQGIQTIANHFKYCLSSYELPDDLLVISASWFISHLNLLEENPNPPYYFNKSILVSSYSPKHLFNLRKLYWILSDHYYPTQFSGENGIALYNDLDELFNKVKGWSKFHLIGLDHLSPENFELLTRAISNQNSSLFLNRWPVICTSNPANTKPKGFYKITI